MRQASCCIHSDVPFFANRKIGNKTKNELPDLSCIGAGYRSNTCCRIKAGRLDNKIVGKIKAGLERDELAAFEDPVLPGEAVYVLRSEVRITKSSIQRITVVDKRIQH